MGCVWFVFKGQSYSVQAFQRTKDALVRGITCVQSALRQFRKASRHFCLLNATASYSLSFTYVLAICLFVYPNSSDYNCCFRVFPHCKGISGLLQRYHSQATSHSWETGRRKKEKCYLTTKVWNQYLRVLLSKMSHLYLPTYTLRTTLCFYKQSCSHCLRFQSLVFAKYFETLWREMLQYSKYLPN